MKKWLDKSMPMTVLTVRDALFIMGGILLLVAAASVVAGGYSCPIKALFGIPCPGCGMSRAWLSLLTTDFSAAFRYHPFFLYPLLLVAAYIPAFFGKRFYKLCLALIAILTAVYILVWIVRMITLFPGEPPLDPNENAPIYIILKFLFR